MDWVVGSCGSSLILLSQSDFYSMNAALLILLSSRMDARLAPQLLMPLPGQPRMAFIKGFIYKSFLFLLGTGIRPRSSFDDYIKVPDLLRMKKTQHKITNLG